MERRNKRRVRGWGTVFLLMGLLALWLAACKDKEDPEQNLITQDTKSERVVNMFSPMEKSSATAKNVARSASDLTILMAEEELGGERGLSNLHGRRLSG